MTTPVARMKQSAIVISLSGNVIERSAKKGMKEGCSSVSSEVGLAGRICMGMTFNIPAHNPFYSRPKMQIVSHARIRAVSFSNINSSRSVTVDSGEVSNHAVSGSTNTRGIASVLNDLALLFRLAM